MIEPEIITKVEYKWLFGVCEQAFQPAVIVSVAVVISLKIVISFLIWKRKKKDANSSRRDS